VLRTHNGIKGSRARRAQARLGHPLWIDEATGCIPAHGELVGETCFHAAWSGIWRSDPGHYHWFDFEYLDEVGKDLLLSS
jgi:hypothetical protein